MGRPKGSKNKGWTAARRKAMSERMKKRWAEATPEQRARMKKSLNTKGFDTWTHEKRMQIVRSIDQKAKGKKVSATRKRKIAKGEIDPTPQIIAMKKFWESLTPAQKLERINALQSKRKLYRKHYASEKMEETKEYESEHYRGEQTRLYNITKEALSPYGIEPKPKQEIGYYRAIIEHFRPDWVEWEV